MAGARAATPARSGPNTANPFRDSTDRGRPVCFRNSGNPSRFTSAKKTTFRWPPAPPKAARTISPPRYPLAARSLSITASGSDRLSAESASDGFSASFSRNTASADPR